MKDSSIIDFFKDILIPPLCSVCGKVDPGLLCQQCRSSIAEIGSKICNYCGQPLPVNPPNMSGCTFCKDENYSFFRHRSFALYKSGTKELIRKYKFKKIYGLKAIFAGFLKNTYNKYYKYEKIDYIDTVPGEHMKILCQALSKLIKIPFIDNVLRIRKTLKQRELDYFQRNSNIEGAFKVKDCLSISGKSLLLVDDVWTTGNTLSEMSRILKNSGAFKVYMLTLARRV